MENKFELMHQNPELKIIEGRPVCQDCIDGKHSHPNFTDKKMQLENRGDCKNAGKIAGKEYQCNCGLESFFIDGKWEEWEEEKK